MTTIKLFANDQYLTILEQPKIANGDQNSVEVHVRFSNWSDYETSAVFFTSADDTVYEMLLYEGRCTVPHEVLAKPGYLFIGVRGVKPAGVAVKTSTLVKYKLEKGAPAGTGTAVDPTPDVYQQILAELKDIRTSFITVDRLEDEIANYFAKNPPKGGADGKDGAPGKDGADGKDGEDGITPHIGDNGNWYIGETDTGKPSRGEQGEKGEAYTLTEEDTYTIVDAVIKALPNGDEVSY